MMVKSVLKVLKLSAAFVACVGQGSYAMNNKNYIFFSLFNRAGFQKTSSTPVMRFALTFSNPAFSNLAMRFAFLSFKKVCEIIKEEKINDLIRKESQKRFVIECEYWKPITRYLSLIEILRKREGYSIMHS